MINFVCPYCFVKLKEDLSCSACKFIGGKYEKYYELHRIDETWDACVGQNKAVKKSDAGASEFLNKAKVETVINPEPKLKSILTECSKRADNINIAMHDECIKEIGSLEEKVFLDIGGSNGWASKRFVEKGAKFGVVLDINEKLFSEKVDNIINVLGDGYYLPFEDETFDFVFDCSTLHHFLDKMKMLSQVHRVLKVGGLYLSQGNPSKLRGIGSLEYKYFASFGLIETHSTKNEYDNMFIGSEFGNIKNIQVGDNSVMIAEKKDNLKIDIKKDVVCPYCSDLLNDNRMCSKCNRLVKYSYPDTNFWGKDDVRKKLKWNYNYFKKMYESDNISCHLLDGNTNFSHEKYAENCRGLCLDVGCGVGWTLLSLIKNGIISYGIGIDMSYRSISDAISLRNKVELINKAEFINVPFERYYTEDVFDSIIVGDVFEHVYSPVWVLDRICEILKSDGVIVGAIPCDRSSDNISHLHYFNEVELFEFLSRKFRRIEIIKFHIEGTGYRCNFVCKNKIED